MTDARATQDAAPRDAALNDPDAEAPEGEAVRAPLLRPNILDPLFAPVRALPGVGGKPGSWTSCSTCPRAASRAG
jgi:ATP-dependent DNA helicase RecG